MNRNIKVNYNCELNYYIETPNYKFSLNIEAIEK